MSRPRWDAAHVALVGLLGCQSGTDAATTHARVQTADEAPQHPEERVSGLRSLVLHPGKGTRHAAPYDEVTLVFVTRTPDGQSVDGLSTRGHGRQLAMRDLFFGLAEGVALMREGERRRLWIPAPLVRGGVLQSGAQDLTMDVDLVSIHPGIPPPTAPSELTAPADAIRTESGLAYRVLEPGTGTRHPRTSDRVRLAYSAWASNGVMFKTSYGHEPSILPVSGLIPGWSEGVQRMVEGERTRFWIPQALAYDGQSGQPRGTIVLDVHLLEVMPPRP